MLKRQRLTPRDDDKMKWLRREISGIKETLEEMVSEARQDRDKVNSMFEELTYDAREERDNIQSMLAELLAEVQWDRAA